MFKTSIIFIFVLILTFTACVSPKKIFFFDESIPQQIFTPGASQEFFEHPPLYIPKGNRTTIFVYSPRFTLAIPNAMDVTGRSNELQKSLADILYTEMFNYPGKKRIDLLDRGMLVNLDIKIILDSLNIPKPDSTVQEDKAKTRDQDISTVPPSPKTQEEKLIDKVGVDTNDLKKYLEKADGILLTYITSRVGNQSGYFEVDYRIVINKGIQERTVLLAGSEKIHYSSSTSSALEYKREDIRKIAKRIYDDMTLQLKETWKAQIIKCDPPIIVINIGKEHNLMPGMVGYVVEWDESVQIQEENNDGSVDISTPQNYLYPPHYSYIAEFIVTDVFDKTSNAVLIRQDAESGKSKSPEFDWDVRVDDVVIIK